MTDTTVSEDNQGTRQNVKAAANMLQGIYGAFAFTVMSQENWLATLQAGVGHYLFFPMFAALAIFKMGLYFYDLIQSKNKNLGKVASLVREIISAAVIGLAIVGGLIEFSLLVAIIPLLFVGVMAFNTFYNIAAAVQNAFRWAKAEDSESSAKYKAHFIKHSVGAAFGLGITVGIACMMVFKIAPMAMAIASAAINGAGFVLGVISAIQSYRASKAEENKKFEDKKDKSLAEKQTSDNKQTTVPLLVPTKISDHYFYTRDRDKELVKQEPADKQEYLLCEIDTKILLLIRQKRDDHSRFFSQNKKRDAKIDVLQKLKALVANAKSTIADFNALMNDEVFNTFFNNPFQSFFRQVGDTQDIFKAAELYFKTQPQVSNKLRGCIN